MAWHETAGKPPAETVKTQFTRRMYALSDLDESV